MNVKLSRLDWIIEKVDLFTWHERFKKQTMFRDGSVPFWIVIFVNIVRWFVENFMTIRNRFAFQSTNKQWSKFTE